MRVQMDNGISTDRTKVKTFIDMSPTICAVHRIVASSDNLPIRGQDHRNEISRGGRTQNGSRLMVGFRTY